MIDIIEFKTDRLKMRQWRKEDWPLFAEINSDPVVMLLTDFEIPKPLIF
ncbi:MAG: hypothetical protein KAQ91_07360 [Methylococcales bacterium]|nr:hypothetical protein [Methylococcales bacterium]